MSKDYERLCASRKALVYAAMIRLITRRIARFGVGLTERDARTPRVNIR
jgi:hypothetical protein